ncbi:MAG: YraN family protein [Chlorobium sp.]|uniref:YraN family protein n=1 Tax=Chlorobium sp. TaxID=1095 RepID=UPI002F420247
MTGNFDPHSLGRQGEQLAAEYLIRKGYRIVERNYRARRNEIDIIAIDRGTLCFIEVKTRGSLEKGHPLEAVTPQKQKEIIKAAKSYLLTVENREPDCRFDVIAVLAGPFDDMHPAAVSIEHFIDAFWEETR